MREADSRDYYTLAAMRRCLAPKGAEGIEMALKVEIDEGARAVRRLPR